MLSTATTVDEYLEALPDDRRDAIRAVRDAVNAKLPAGFEERVQYGMIAWTVPESVLPAADVYNRQPLSIVCLASQKNHMALYMLGVYGDAKERKWFESAFKKAGKKLDMGKSCVRFRTIDALPLDVISEAMSHVTVDKYVAAYRAIRGATKRSATRSAKSTKTTKGARAAARTAKKPAKKPAGKKRSAKKR
jgi:uncharacterized protein YdhG (YjbR/CyaY superfamily)